MCESMAHILCLLCGQQQETPNTFAQHLLAHNVNINAPATEEHTAQNLNMFNYTCLHCDKKGSVKTKSAKKKNYLQCRFCDTYQCLDSLCQKTYSTYKGFMQHRIVKHSWVAWSDGKNLNSFLIVTSYNNCVYFPLHFRRMPLYSLQLAQMVLYFQCLLKLLYFDIK